MSYAFQPDDASVVAALRRIAAEQIDRARAGLADDRMPAAQRAHAARKSIKKTRALLRLVRPAFARFKAENRALRDIGRGLAPLRDAGVVRGLVERLAEEAGLVPADRAALIAGFEPASAQDDDVARRVAEATRAFDDLADRVAGWTLSKTGFAALEGGLGRSWSDGRAALEPALRRADPEALHAWRKRVKDHWYHARLLAGIWPEVMAVRISVTDRLGTRLGDHQDLVMLAERLDPASVAAQAVVAVARRKRAEILAEVTPLGRRLYAERTKALARRWGSWWHLAEPALPLV